MELQGGRESLDKPRLEVAQDQLRMWWQRNVKTPFYWLALQVAPNSKPARKYVPPEKLEANHQRVASAVAPGSKPYDLVLFSIIDWHFRIQRPQQLCRQFARMGYRVFYVESSILSISDPVLLRRGYSFVDSPEPNILVCQVHCALPKPDVYRVPMSLKYAEAFLAGMDRLRQDHEIRSVVSVLQNPFWRPLAEAIPGNLVVYDCLDFHGGFSTGTEQMHAEEARLLRSADLILTSSANLAQKVSRTTDHVLVRNAVEFSFFSQRPQTIKRPSSRPVVGYYGAIADWFNIEWVISAAKAFPEWDFWLVGAASEENLKAAREIKNIIFTGEVPYRELTSYLYGMDVCMIPFLENELTRCTNPVKVYEYLAAGKSVVASPMPELQLIADYVRIAHSAGEFCSALQAAMKDPGSTGEIKNRVAWAAEQDWSVRARQIEQEIRNRFPLVSIIILTHNNLDHTKVCLASLIELTDYPNCEVIVVDNGSTDGTVSFLKDFAGRNPHVRIILNPQNGGFAAGNNLGIKAAQGEYVVLLNNDTHCTRGWLRGLLRHLVRNPDIGAVGPVTNNIGNEAKIDLRYSSMDEMERAACNYALRHRHALLDVKTVAFFCVALPRAVIEEVGLLDECFGLGFFEDDDYCNRIRKMGRRVCIAEDVFIHHELSASFSSLPATKRAELFEKNLILYESKWGKWIPHKYRVIPNRLSPQKRFLRFFG